MVISSGDRWRFKVFFMKVKAAAIAGFGDVALEDLAFLIDCTPEVDHLAMSFTYISSRDHFHCRKPLIRLTRCLQISPANIDPNLFHQWRL